MKTAKDYITTRVTLYDIHEELKKRRCKSSAKVVENMLEAWEQIEKDLDLKTRLPEPSIT